MLRKRFPRPIRRLRGKLTLSYMLTSVVTFLFIELIFIAVVLWYVKFNIQPIILNDLKQEAPQVAPYFLHGTPDSQELTAGLRVIDTNLPSLGPPGQSNAFYYLSVVNPQGQVLASIGSQPQAVNAPIQSQLSAQGKANLRAVLSDPKGTTSRVDQEADNTLLAEVPIVGNGGRLVGALVWKNGTPNILALVQAFLSLILVTCLVMTIIAAIAGLIFGSLTARGLTRRLRKLASAADKWSHGDFSASTHDDSQDELGQLSRRLNSMAEELQDLLATQQKLATLEERNRLARDLHDSVKQQVFAISMQIAATKILLKRDAEAAEGRLNETEKLVRQAQQELTSLIRELRPAALDGKGLVEALRELTTQWAEQTGIVVNLRVEDSRIAPLAVAVEEALYRIAQEALSNIARHSKATLAQMVLHTAGDTVTLTIADNGQGFDTAQPAHLGVGLPSMRERMKALGGDVQLESTPGNGTHITAYCRLSGVPTTTTFSNQDKVGDRERNEDTFTQVEHL
jgi:signal transduction histidine kinase